MQTHFSERQSFAVQSRLSVFTYGVYDVVVALGIVIPSVWVRSSLDTPKILAALADVVIAVVWRTIEVGSIPTGSTKYLLA